MWAYDIRASTFSFEHGHSRKPFPLFLWQKRALLRLIRWEAAQSMLKRMMTSKVVEICRRADVARALPRYSV